MVAIAYQPEPYATIEEYWAAECESDTKHEYVNGLIVAMAGGSPTHNTIAGNAFASLHRQLRGKSCRPYNSDQRIVVPSTGLRAFPDVSVACPPFEWDENIPDTLKNPKVVIEVLSPSTEGFDGGAKFAHYQPLESVTDILLISQNRSLVEHHRRQDGGWLFTEYENAGEVPLHSIECSLLLEDVYERVEFEA